MTVERINPPGMPKAFGSYCQAARRGSIVTTAGVAALDADGRIVGVGDIEAQTVKTLENLELALQSCGAGLQDVLKVTCYITDFKHYAGFNRAFDRFFAAHPPARATVRADLVLSELLIEIDAIAVLP